MARTRSTGHVDLQVEINKAKLKSAKHTMEVFIDELDDQMALDPTIKLTDQQKQVLINEFRTMATQIGKNFNEEFNNINWTGVDKGLKKIDTDSASIKRNFKALGYETDEVVNTIKTDMVSAIKKVDTASGGIANPFKDFGETLTNTTKWAIASRVINEFIGGIERGVSVVKELDSKMTEVAIVTGKTRSETRELTLEYNNLAHEMSVTTSEIAEASVEFYRQGLTDEEVLQRLTVTTQYAKISAIEFSDAAEILTATTNGMEIDITRAADVMAYLGDATATGADEIGIAMQKASGSAGALGIEYEKIASWIATISSRTRESAESIGTSLKTLLARMAKVKDAGFDEESGDTINEVATALKEAAGIDLLGLDGQFRNFGDVIDEVGAKWETFDSIQQGAIATALAGQKQQARFLTLMEGYGESLDYYAGAMGAAGVATQKYQVYEESLQASTDRLTASTEKFWLTLLNTSIVKWFIDSLDIILNRMTDMEFLLPVVVGIIVALISTTIPTLLAQLTSIGIALKKTTGEVALATGGLSLLFGALAMGTTILVQSLLEAKNSVDPLVKSLENLNDTREDSIKAAQATADLANDQLSILDELVSKYQLYGKGLDDVNFAIDALNRLVPDLNLAYDEQTNSLSLTNEEIRNNISLIEEQSIATAAATYLQSAQNAKIDAEIEQQIIKNNLAIAEQEEARARAERDRIAAEIESISTINSRTGTRTADSPENRQKLRELNSEYTDLSNTISSLSTVTNSLENDLNNSAEALAEVTEEVNNTTKAMRDLGQLPPIEVIDPRAEMAKMEILISETMRLNEVGREEAIKLINTIEDESIALNVLSDGYVQVSKDLFQLTNDAGEVTDSLTAVEYYLKRTGEHEESVTSISEAFEKVSEGGKLSADEISALLPLFDDYNDAMVLIEGTKEQALASLSKIAEQERDAIIEVIDVMIESARMALSIKYMIDDMDALRGRGDREEDPLFAEFDKWQFIKQKYLDSDPLTLFDDDDDSSSASEESLEAYWDYLQQIAETEKDINHLINERAIGNEISTDALIEYYKQEQDILHQLNEQRRTDQAALVLELSNVAEGSQEAIILTKQIADLESDIVATSSDWYGIQQKITGEYEDIAEAAQEAQDELDKAAEEREEEAKAALENYLDYLKYRTEGEIDSLERQQEAMEAMYDARIDQLDSQIDAQKTINDLIQEELDREEKILDIQKQQQTLDAILENKNTLLYNGDINDFEWVANPDDVLEAQENLQELTEEYNDWERKLAEEKYIDSLENQKDALEKQKDLESASFDARIQLLEDYIDKYENVMKETFDFQYTSLDQLQSEFGEFTENMNIAASALSDFNALMGDLATGTNETSSSFGGSDLTNTSDGDNSSSVGTSAGTSINFTDQMTQEMMAQKGESETMLSVTDRYLKQQGYSSQDVADYVYGTDSINDMVEAGRSNSAYLKWLYLNTKTQSVDNYNDFASQYMGRTVNAAGYSTGGINTNKEFAQLHGTESSVETIFNATDGKKLWNFVNNLPSPNIGVTKDIGSKNISTTTTGNSYSFPNIKVYANNMDDFLTSVNEYAKRKI